MGLPVRPGQPGGEVDEVKMGLPVRPGQPGGEVDEVKMGLPVVQIGQKTFAVSILMNQVEAVIRAHC